MLDANLKTQLRAYMERITQPVQLIASLDDRPASAEMLALLEDIVSLSDKVTLRMDGSDERRPSFQITRAGHDMGLRFAAVPLGHEFTSLVLALLQAGGHPPKIDAETIERILGLVGDYHF
ncbi:MAG: alkyl hydroperoxide reductase subunit F, partial [Rubrivivax sp.]|nr:alkyl hydroperoxide reductase subunit F [Rubrivivax sp.]